MDVLSDLKDLKTLVDQKHQEYLHKLTLPRLKDERTHRLLERNPMSPYDIPQSQLNYGDIAEVISCKGYKAVYPQTFTPVSDYFTKNNLNPYFSPGEDTDYAPGMLTIAGMIELSNMGGDDPNAQPPWKISRDEDIPEIINLTRAYYDYLQQGLRDPQIKLYAKKVEKFLRIMDKAQERMLRRHGKLKAKTLSVAELLSKLIR